MRHIMICPTCSKVIGRGNSKDGFNIYDMAMFSHCADVWYSSDGWVICEVEKDLTVWFPIRTSG